MCMCTEYVYAHTAVRLALTGDIPVRMEGKNNNCKCLHGSQGRGRDKQVEQGQAKLAELPRCLPMSCLLARPFKKYWLGVNSGCARRKDKKESSRRG